MTEDKKDKEGVVPIQIAPSTRTRLKNYRIAQAAKNYTQAIERLLDMTEAHTDENKYE